jgi:hypothetical protein
MEAMATKPAGKRRLSEADLNNPDLDDDGNLDVEHYPLPDASDIDDQYLAEVWDEAVNSYGSKLKPPETTNNGPSKEIEKQSRRDVGKVRRVTLCSDVGRCGNVRTGGSTGNPRTKVQDRLAVGNGPSKEVGDVPSKEVQKQSQNADKLGSAIFCVENGGTGNARAGGNSKNTGAEVQDRPTAGLVTSFPDIRQPNHYTCGAAAFTAVCQWYKKEMTVGRAVKLLGTNLQKSTDPGAIVRELRKLGIAAQPKKGMTLEDLEAETSAGKPVIVCVQDYGDRREQGASFEYGHYLTVLACSGGVVTCQDSSLDNVEREPGGDVPRSQADQSGNIAIPGRVVIAADEFVKVWHDQRANGEKLEHFGIVCGPRQAVGEVRTKGFPTVQAAGKWLADKWASLENRYGRAGALSMAVAMLATSPLPGNIPAVIAAAEAVRGISGYFQRELGGSVEKLSGNPNLATPAMGRRTAPRNYMG